MAEYIDKNATVVILEAMSRNADCECIKKRLEKAAKRVNTMPAADADPVVRSRWRYCGFCRNAKLAGRFIRCMAGSRGISAPTAEQRWTEVSTDEMPLY